MSYEVGQHVEVQDQQGAWTSAVIYDIRGDLYRVAYSPEVLGVCWWPESRVRALVTAGRKIVTIDEYTTTLTEQGLISLRMCIREVINDQKYNREFLQEVRRFPLLMEALKATRENYELYDFNNFWLRDLAQAIHKRAFDLLEQKYTKS